MKKVLFVVAFLATAIGQITAASEKLAILPVAGTGIDAVTQETVYQLLLSEVRKQNCYDLIAESDIAALLAGNPCAEPSCAAEIGRRTGATKAVVAGLNRLGEKIIFQYSMVETSTNAVILSDALNALHVEDLDQVTRRVSLSICQLKPVDKTIEVGLVTEQETEEARSRKANSMWGIGFGYIYPSKGYDDENDVFVWDFRSLYEMKNVTVDALLGLRKGISLNVGLLYLTSRKDFCPFLGAGVGFHAVSHKRYYAQYDYYSYESDVSSDGLEILLKGGLLAFRTYDFRVVIQGEYSITFNEYDDQGFLLTIGVLRAGKKVFGIF